MTQNILKALHWLFSFDEVYEALHARHNKEGVAGKHHLEGLAGYKLVMFAFPSLKTNTAASVQTKGVIANVTDGADIISCMFRSKQVELIMG